MFFNDIFIIKYRSDLYFDRLSICRNFNIDTVHVDTDDLMARMEEWVVHNKIPANISKVKQVRNRMVDKLPRNDKI